jgi:3-dehydroquinate synthase
MTESVTRIRVNTASPYDVLVGTRLLGLLPALLGDRVRRVAVIRPRSLAGTGDRISAELAGRGYESTLVEIPDSEAAKTSRVAERCWAELGMAGFTRTDAVVGVGGGAATDLAGFVAGTWLRGITVVHVPTTLLGMVDAAVGGKTAINIAQGKNLVGVFHEPAGVVCDLAALATLPPDELASGLAEVIKCGFIADATILDIIERDPQTAVRQGEVLCDLVERAIRVKADVVAGDVYETMSTGTAVATSIRSGHAIPVALRREMLNYGHTLAHAIERNAAFHFRHGDAVAIGMVYAAELARLAGYLDEATADRHRLILSTLGLPTTYPQEAWPDLLNAMRLDKKTRGDQMRLVILKGLGEPAILEGPDPELLAAAYAAIAG